MFRIGFSLPVWVGLGSETGLGLEYCNGVNRLGFTLVKLSLKYEVVDGSSTTQPTEQLPL